MDTLPPIWGDDDEPDVENAFGEHDIEYWVWRGHTLIPATPEQAAALREREAFARLTRWQQAQERARTRGERHGLAAVAWAVRVAVAHSLVALAGLPSRLAHRPASGDIRAAMEMPAAPDKPSGAFPRGLDATAEQRADEAGMSQT
jgi:hypothetical protein